eukprot:TRINITY_DN1120_c0_g1_i1.p1 TRINITY_DN1120_c0_g1~~TRINITY_DN1120_c0_g1_i1.p1  ORF type:complete len:503 (+),score=161.74 TRINITY_DN1120_c0_g1_i1:187-1509(+)
MALSSSFALSLRGCRSPPPSSPSSASFSSSPSTSPSSPSPSPSPSLSLLRQSPLSSQASHPLSSVLLRGAKKDGMRFGPRLSRDGGRIFQSSSRDIETIIRKKGLSEKEIDEFYHKGILHKWLASPRQRPRTRLVEYDGVSGWKRWESQRVGLLGRKIGMKREIDLWGHVHPVTLVQIQDNHVMATKGVEAHQNGKKKPDYLTMQVGGGIENWHSVQKQQMGEFAKHDIPAKEFVTEFPISKDAVLPPGTPLLATHFVAGQFVDAYSISKGKGTQGVMKRHGFSGLAASHGVSLAHRSGGSIASGATDPGRVLKGTKMAGQMGHTNTRQLNLQILKIDTHDQILFIKGSIPGPKKGWIKLVDSLKKAHRLPPPHPTHLPEVQLNRPVDKKKYLRMKYADPYMKKRETDWPQRWNEAKGALKTALHDLGEDDGDDNDGGIL